MKDDFLQKLSDAQRKAVLHKEGAALVLAGPGSGKTTVITNRIANLIVAGKIKPERILTVTFSRAAAAEMEQRSVRLMRNFGDCGEQERAAFCTLHSYCNTVLKNLYTARNKPYKILSADNEKYRLIKDIVENVNRNIHVNSQMYNPEIISGLISKQKSVNMSNDKEKRLNLRSEIQIRNFDKIFDEYERIKRERGLVDFDDMLIFMYEELSNNNELAQTLSSQYDFVQVDEGQDLSLIQVEIMKKISLHENIFLVADDDQGIYSFRGADTDGLRLFENSFTSCKRYILDENYRSGGNIVNASVNVIKWNVNRYEKNLYAHCSNKGKIKLYRTADVYSQAKFTAEIAARNANMKRTTGILYRNNMSALLPIAVLESMYGVKYTVSGGAVKPCENNIVNDFLKLRHKPLPDDEFYEKVFQDYKNSCIGERETEIIIDFLKFMCNLYTDIEDVKYAIINYGQIPIAEKNKDIEKYIHFSTIHSAKGLEYDEVIIIDTYEDEFPPRGSCFGHLLEEERRLFYVAMTRAKQTLYVLFPQKFGKRKVWPSIFYGELKNAIKTARAQKKNRA